MRDLLLTALAPCTWGTTYLVTTALLPPDRPLSAAVARVLPVGLAMAALAGAPPSRRWWWRLGVLGLLNIAVFQALLFVAAYRLPGGVAATLGAASPLATAALAALLLGTRHPPRIWLAAVGGLAGVALLVLAPGARLDLVGVAAALIGTLVMALATVLAKDWGQADGGDGDRPPLIGLVGWQLAIGGLLLLPCAILFEPPPAALTWGALAGMAYLGLLGTGLAYVLWFRGLARLPVATVALLALLSPLVATVLGSLWNHERLGAIQAGGALLVLACVILGLPARRQAAATP